MQFLVSYNNRVHFMWKKSGLEKPNSGVMVKKKIPLKNETPNIFTKKLTS